MPLNTTASHKAARTAAASGVDETGGARRTGRSGEVADPPASASSARRNKLKDISKKINSALVRMKAEMASTQAEIKDSEEILRGMDFSDHGEDTVPEMMEKSEDLSDLYLKMSEHCAAQLSKVRVLLGRFGDVASENKLSELNELETTLAMDADLYQGRSSVQTAVYNTLSALDEEAQMKENFAFLKMSPDHPQALANILEFKRQAASSLYDAALVLMEVNAPRLTAVLPAGLPKALNVDTAGKLLGCLLEYGAYYRQETVVQLTSLHENLGTEVTQLANSMVEARNRFEQGEIDSADYFKPLLQFRKLESGQAGRFQMLEKVGQTLAPQIELMEFRDNDRDIRELHCMQGLLLDVTKLNLQANLLRIEYIGNHDLMEKDLRNQSKDFCSPELPNVSGVLAGIRNVGDLQRLVQQHLHLQADFPVGLNNDQKQAIYPRLRLLKEEMDRAHGCVDMLCKDYNYTVLGENPSQGARDMAMQLASLRDNLALAGSMLTNNLGRLVKSRFVPQRAANARQGDTSLTALKHALSDIEGKWDLALPGAAAAAAFAAEDTSDDEPGESDDELTTSRPGTAVTSGLRASARPEAPAGASAAQQARRSGAKAGAAAMKDLVNKLGSIELASETQDAAARAAAIGSAQKRFDAASKFTATALPALLAPLEKSAVRHRSAAEEILENLGNKKDMEKSQPSNVLQNYKCLVNDLQRQRAALATAARKWRKVKSPDPETAKKTGAELDRILSMQAVLDMEIKQAQKQGLRKTANAYAFKPSNQGMKFLFDHGFIDLIAPTITPYYVIAHKSRLDVTENDADKRWKTETDQQGNALEESYQVFGIQIVPDPQDKQSKGKNRLNYQVFLHALLDDGRPEAGSDDGKSFHPDADLKYSQYKWKRGDEHTRGKRWVDRQVMEATRQGNGHGVEFNAAVYRNFADEQALKEYVPRYLRMTGNRGMKLELVDLRESCRLA